MSTRVTMLKKEGWLAGPFRRTNIIRHATSMNRTLVSEPAIIEGCVPDNAAQRSGRIRCCQLCSDLTFAINSDHLSSC